MLLTVLAVMNVGTAEDIAVGSSAGADEVTEVNWRCDLQQWVQESQVGSISLSWE